MLEHFENLLAAAAARPRTRLSDLPLLSPEERRRVLDDWNATGVPYPRERSIGEIFESRVASDPGAVAVSCGEKRLTYGELNARANQLAHFLRRRGVGPQEPVGLALERSAETIVALLGILKAGGAYVPLDPSYPEERLALMARDAGIRLILTKERHAGRLSSTTIEAVCLDRARRRWNGESRENPPPVATGESLACVLYTSGSTGAPKGVEVLQRGVARLLFGVDYARLDSTRRLLHLAPLSFDASTFEIWGALLHGARCVVFPDIPVTPGNLSRVLAREQIDTLWLTASLFNVVMDEAPGALSGVRQLLVGGEALSVPHVEAALARLPETRIVNGYGPTECTTFACAYAIETTRPPCRSAGRLPTRRRTSSTPRVTPRRSECRASSSSAAMVSPAATAAVRTGLPRDSSGWRCPAATPNGFTRPETAPDTGPTERSSTWAASTGR